jgi:predicted lipoprotein with Yx(FWY)xxD motif
MHTPTARAIALLGISALLAAGCGSSKSSKAGSAASATPASSGSQSHNSSSSGSNASGSAGSGAGTAITVKRASKLGAVLAAGPKRMTVYLFEADKGSASNCSGACASAWPPVTTSGAPVAAKGALAADLGTIKRSDGTTQVTYKGHPLYYFTRDGDAGDAYGEGVVGFGASWYAVSPQGSKIDNS